MREQNIHIETLFECIDSLRSQVVKYTQASVDPTQKYQNYDEMMNMYKDSHTILEKIKRDKQTEVKTDLLDMHMERVRLNTEREMLDRAIREVT